MKPRQLEVAHQSPWEQDQYSSVKGDRSTQAKSLNNLGIAYLNTGNVKQAIA